MPACHMKYAVAAARVRHGEPDHHRLRAQHQHEQATAPASPQSRRGARSRATAARPASVPSQALRVREMSEGPRRERERRRRRAARAVPGAGQSRLGDRDVAGGRRQRARRRRARRPARRGRTRAARLSTSSAPATQRRAVAGRVRDGRGARVLGEREPRRRQDHRRHQQARRRHVVAEEAARPVVHRVEAEEVVLHERPGREHEPAEQRRVQQALAVAHGGGRVDREVEQHEEHELLGGRLRHERRLRERRRQERPDAERERRAVEREPRQRHLAAGEAQRRTPSAARAVSSCAAKIETEQVAATAATSAELGALEASLGDGRFLRKHDRDVLADRVDALALGAAQAGAVLDELHGRLAHGTGQDLEQVGMDRHGPSLRHSPFAGQTDPRPAAPVVASCCRTRRTRRASLPKQPMTPVPEARDRSRHLTGGRHACAVRGEGERAGAAHLRRRAGVRRGGGAARGHEARRASRSGVPRRARCRSPSRPARSERAPSAGSSTTCGRPSRRRGEVRRVKDWILDEYRQSRAA